MTNIMETILYPGAAFAGISIRGLYTCYTYCMREGYWESNPLTPETMPTNQLIIPAGELDEFEKQPSQRAF